MIDYKSYDISLDIEYHINMAAKLFNTDTVKVTGAKGHNKFVNIKGDDKSKLQHLVDSIVGTQLDWNFDYFHSGEPAGLHTDNDTVPWDSTVDCNVVAGVIIPLEWTCKQPYTVNYNKVSDVPRKMMYRRGEMRYTHNDEVYHYRDRWEYDLEVLKYNPADCAYAKEYADLKVDSVYEWKIGTLLLFNAARWPSSSWFLTDRMIPEVSTEYKRSIIGFGSIDVQRS